MMKYLLPVMLPLVLAMNVLAAPQVVPAPVDHLFVPKGFDNNDNVEVLVSGKFPNACYARNKVEIGVKEDVIDVKITALFQEENLKNCEKIEIPYLENVTIGSLQAGDYQVVVNGELKEKLLVEEAKSNSVDDHLYAQVDYVELGFTGGINGDVFLVGRTTDCMAFDHLETLSNGKDTISVLPIMKRVSNDCTGRRNQFTIPMHFEPQALDFHQVLLFVRTLDGKSVHTLIDKI